MSYYPYYNYYGYQPNGGQPCGNDIQYQGQGQQHQPCPTGVQYYQIDGCRPFDPCTLDYQGPTGVTGTILFLNKEKTAYTSSDNLYYDPEAHSGLGKLYIKGGLDPIYAQLEPQTSNPNVGQTGTIWYNKNDSKLYLDNNALVHNTSNFVQLKKQTTNPNIGQNGTLWIKEGENALYLDNTIIIGGGGVGGNAETSGGLGPGATGTSITLFSSQTNPRPAGIPSSTTECPPGQPGTLWVNCDGSLMFNDVQVIGPDGNTIYANDPWMYKNMIGQPPAPTIIQQQRPGIALKDYLETYSTISIKWTPPEQRRIGMINEPIPVIRNFKILLTDANGINQSIINTALSQTEAQALLNTQASELILYNSAIPQGQTTRYNITGTAPNKIINYYLGGLVLQEPYDIKIWYENTSQDNINPLEITNAQFIPPGPPSAPSISFNDSKPNNKTQNSITITVEKGTYTDAINLLNEVDLNEYYIYYKATLTQKIITGLDKSEQRIIHPINPRTSPYKQEITITGLLPLTTYEIRVTTKNIRNASESGFSSIITQETLGPSPNTAENISSTDLKSKFPSVYREAYKNGILITDPVVYSGQGWRINMGPYYVSTNPQTISSILDVQIDATNNTYDITEENTKNPQIQYNRNSTAPNIRVSDTGLLIPKSDKQSEIIIFNGNKNSSNQVIETEAIFDPNSSNVNAGLFLQAYSGIDVNSSAFIGSYSKYNLKYRIKIERPIGTITEVVTSNDFYIDDLPISGQNAQPSFENITGLVNERIIYVNSPETTNVKSVCGIAMINGNWRLRIGRIKMKNTVYYFHYKPILQYTFAEKKLDTLVESIPDFASGPEYTFLTDFIGGDVSLIGRYISGNDQTFRYRPSLTLKANNINKDNFINNTSTTFQIRTIIDYESIQSALVRNNNSYLKEALISGADCFSSTIINNLNTNGITTDDNIFNGQRMLTSRETNILSDFATARTVFDNININLAYEGADEINANTGIKISGKNDLIMINGKFMTRAYNGSGSEGAYKNYANEIDGDINRPDYFGLQTETKYRYVTMRWKYRTNAISGLAFKIVEIDSDPIVNKVTGKGLVIGTTISDPDIKLYYRIEDPNINSGNPSNVPFTQSNGAGISSVWIDANSTTNNDKFSRWLGILSNSGQIGGITNLSDISIIIDENNKKSSVIYNVSTPIVNLGNTENSKREIYIYAMIGVPMNSNIAFKELQCCLINDSGLTMPSLQGGVYIDGITKDIENEYRVNGAGVSGRTYGYINGTRVEITSNDIILYDIGAPRLLTIKPPEKIYISPSEVTTLSEIQAEITVGATTHFFKFKYDVNNDVQTDNIITSSQSTPTIISLQHQEPSTIIRDLYETDSAYKRGYYMYTLLKILLNIRNNSLLIENGLNKYEIKLRYIYSISGVSQTEKIKIFNLYLDKLPNNAAPVINSFNVVNAKGETNADTIFVSGIPVNNGLWGLSLNTINTLNVLYWYYYSPIIQYSFLNNNNQTLITDTTKSSNTGQVIFADTSQSESSVSINASSRYEQFIYRPSITLKANSININSQFNTSANNTKNVEIIVDYPSYNLLYDPANPERLILDTSEKILLIGTSASVIGNIVTNATYGKLMKTSVQSFINTTLINGTQVKNIFTDYSTARNGYDNQENIATTATNSLQIMNGLFITKSYSINNINQASYQDYSNIKSGINYSGIPASGYRWATFKWQVQNADFNKLQLCIDGISLGSGTTIIEDNNDKRLKVTKTTIKQNIELYYRFEQLAHNTTIASPNDTNAANPQNISNTATNGKNISSIWINANDSSTSISFGQRLGGLEHSGSLSGISGNETDIQISSINTQTHVMYNVNCPIVDLKAASYPNKNVNIYAMIGLPMDMDIAIKGIKAYVYKQ